MVIMEKLDVYKLDKIIKKELNQILEYCYWGIQNLEKPPFWEFYIQINQIMVKEWLEISKYFLLFSKIVIFS